MAMARAVRGRRHLLSRSSEESCNPYLTAVISSTRGLRILMFLASNALACCGLGINSNKRVDDRPANNNWHIVSAFFTRKKHFQRSRRAVHALPHLVN